MIILGGASRTGKGIISQKLMMTYEMPFLSIDPIKMALHRSIPSYELNTNGSSIQVSEELWPFVSTIIKNMVETGVNYIIEGEILPKHVRELSDYLGIEIAACFIGYSELQPEEKVRQIKTHSGYPNDWTSELTDDELYTLVKDSIEYSKYLKKECLYHQIKYVDFSFGFDNNVTKVLGHFLMEIDKKTIK